MAELDITAEKTYNKSLMFLSKNLDIRPADNSGADNIAYEYRINYQVQVAQDFYNVSDAKVLSDIPSYVSLSNLSCNGGAKITINIDGRAFRNGFLLTDFSLSPKEKSGSKYMTSLQTFTAIADEWLIFRINDSTADAKGMMDIVGTNTCDPSVIFSNISTSTETKDGIIDQDENYDGKLHTTFDSKNIIFRSRAITSTSKSIYNVTAIATLNNELTRTDSVTACFNGSVEKELKLTNFYNYYVARQSLYPSSSYGSKIMEEKIEYNTIGAWDNLRPVE